MKKTRYVRSGEILASKESSEAAFRFLHVRSADHRERCKVEIAVQLLIASGVICYGTDYWVLQLNG